MIGLDKFKEYFMGYQDQYVLIGGAACDIIFEEQDTAFRATKELDLVLIVEALTPAFGHRFWQFSGMAATNTVPKAAVRRNSIGSTSPRRRAFHICWSYSPAPGMPSPVRISALVCRCLWGMSYPVYQLSC